jgi:pimeloyl-ACP methyl ester carboxylesterase
MLDERIGNVNSKNLMMDQKHGSKRNSCTRESAAAAGMAKSVRVLVFAGLCASLGSIPGPVLAASPTPAPNRGSFAEVEGSKLYYEECGSGPRVVGPVVTGLPYSQHFLDRGRHAFELLGKGDVKGAIAEWSQDRYLIAPGNDAARKRLFDLMTAYPQDMTHRDYPLRNKPALPRLQEIRVPTLILTGEADIPDVHAHAGAIEAGIPTRGAWSSRESATSCASRNPRSSAGG